MYIVLKLFGEIHASMNPFYIHPIDHCGEKWSWIWWIIEMVEINLMDY